MALKDKLDADLKNALRDRNEVARDTIRMLKADLLNREVELGRPLDSSEEMAVLTRALKTRQDSAAQYDQGGRADLAEKERAEIAIVSAYLPAAMNEDELREAAKALIDELGVSSKKEMGRVIKALGERHPGRVDGRVASKVVSGLLS